MLQEYVLEIRHIKERTMSLPTASQECESIARKFYKLSFLEGEGVMESRCKYLSYWNLLECNVTQCLYHNFLLSHYGTV